MSFAVGVAIKSTGSGFFLEMIVEFGIIVVVIGCATHKQLLTD